MPNRDWKARASGKPRRHERPRRPWHRDAVARDKDAPVVIFGWHPVKAALENPATRAAAAHRFALRSVPASNADLQQHLEESALRVLTLFAGGDSSVGMMQGGQNIGGFQAIYLWIMIVATVGYFVVIALQIAISRCPRCREAQARCESRPDGHRLRKFAPDSMLEQRGFELLVPRVAEKRWRTDKLRSCVMAVVGAGPPMSAPFTVGLVVRIPFAPAESLRTIGSWAPVVRWTPNVRQPERCLKV